MSQAARIVLGTVQLGLPYGVANQQGKPDQARSSAIIKTARRGGIALLDTAVAYGDSEVRLGRVGVSDFGVMTKLPAIPVGVQDPADWVRSQVQGSLDRLGLRSLWALSFHRLDQLLSPVGSEIYRAMAELQQKGVVQRLGISIYDPAELELFAARFRFELVQLPVNVLDRRITRSTWAEKLATVGCEFHARSAFLQGLLLLPPNGRPAYFRRWQPLFDAWDAWIQDSATSPLQACIGHALSVPGVSRVVVGVDDEQQLAQILASLGQAGQAVPERISSVDPDLLNPSRWPPN